MTGKREMKQSAKSPYFLVLVLLLTITASAPCGHHSGQEANLKTIRMLIVDGFSNHDWQQTTRVIRQILESSEFFDIDVSTAPSSPGSPEWDTWRPRFSAFNFSRR